VEIVVVAAEDPTCAHATPAADQADEAGPRPANSNARSARGTGSTPARAAGEAAPAPARPGVAVPPDLASLATSIGQAWSEEYVRTLQEQERDIVGAWPGTIREARRQVLARIKTKLEPEQLDQLARITNLAARRG
jgi:hypothetical protein